MLRATRKALRKTLRQERSAFTSSWLYSIFKPTEQRLHPLDVTDLTSSAVEFENDDVQVSLLRYSKHGYIELTVAEAITDLDIHTYITEELALGLVDSHGEGGADGKLASGKRAGHAGTTAHHPWIAAEFEV